MIGQTYESVLDDALQWTYKPVHSAAALAAVAEKKRQEKFEARWLEQDSGMTDDIERLLGKAEHIAGVDENVQMGALVINAARCSIRLDRQRRIGLGYVRPRPKSVLAGTDGGVDTHRYRRRRSRPATVQHKSSTATPCLAPEPCQFDNSRAVAVRTVKLGRGIKGSAVSFEESSSPTEDCHGWKQMVDNLLCSAPKDSAMLQVLRHLTGQ